MKLGQGECLYPGSVLRFLSSGSPSRKLFSVRRRNRKRHKVKKSNVCIDSGVLEQPQRFNLGRAACKCLRLLLCKVDQECWVCRAWPETWHTLEVLAVSMTPQNMPHS